MMREAVQVMRAGGVGRATTNIYGDQIVITDEAVTINGQTWSI